MSWAWLPICLVLLVGAAGALVWLHLGLRQDFDSLRARLRRVDAENKNRLEELQKIRLNIRELKLNLTNTASELQEMSTALGLLTKEVTELKTTASNLQESIASAPQIKGLPNAVKDLKQARNISLLMCIFSTLSCRGGVLVAIDVLPTQIRS